jgi:hypothetical protein
MADVFSRSFAVNGKPLPWAPFFQSLQVAKSITDHADRAILHFIGMAPEVIAQAALAVNANLTFRWGSGPNVSIPHSYVIHTVDLQYIQNQAMARIHLIDSRVHLMANSAFSSFPHHSFSQIVSAIAKSYAALPAAIVRADKYIADVLHTGAHHWAFLSALKREGCVAADNGDSDYRLYFRGGNELHFHPPDYSQAPYRTIVVGATVAPGMNMRMASWKPILGGSVGFRASNFSKDAAIPLSAASTETSPHPKLTEGAKPISSNFMGAFLGRFFHTHHDTKPHLEQDAAVGASSAVYSANSMEITLEGDPGMEPGCLVRIVYKDPSTSQPMTADGLWLVEHVFHEIHLSAMGRTKLKLSRTNTSQVGSQRIAGTNSPTSGTGNLSAYNGAYTNKGQVAPANGILGVDGNITYWDSRIPDTRPFVWGQRTIYR